MINTSLIKVSANILNFFTGATCAVDATKNPEVKTYIDKANHLSFILCSDLKRLATQKPLDSYTVTIINSLSDLMKDDAIGINFSMEYLQNNISVIKDTTDKLSNLKPNHEFCFQAVTERIVVSAKDITNYLTKVEKNCRSSDSVVTNYVNV
jgi:hypothetical protein